MREENMLIKSYTYVDISEKVCLELLRHDKLRPKVVYGVCERMFIYCLMYKSGWKLQIILQ